MDSDPVSQSIMGKVILLIILTLFNAFFAAAEMAVASLNEKRVMQKAEQGDKKAAKLVKLLENPTNYLSTIQIGITLINLLSGASIANALAIKISGLLGNSRVAFQISNVLAFIILTYVSIVFGELYPKRIAMNKSEDIARFVLEPVSFLSLLTRPFVWLLSASTNLMGRITPMKFDDAEPKMTRDEMQYMLASEGVLDSEELDMVQGVFSLDSKVAREVMVPRTDAFMIDIDDSTPENIDLILEQSYSRVPVYKENRDNIIGILHQKSLLKAAREYGFDSIDLNSILQKPLFVPETIGVDNLLYELQHTQNQMAVLLDEYGGVVGLVTLEDLLEEIVGEIDDETDDSSEEESLLVLNTDGSYTIQGRMLIDEFNEQFDCKLEADDVDTIAGYVLTGLGKIPDEDEKLTYTIDNLTFVTEKMDGPRLLMVKVIFEELNKEIESVLSES
jgi:Hemolysins and related proteins containing CBS domains